MNESYFKSACESASMFSLSKLVVGSSRAKIAQLVLKVSANAILEKKVEMIKIESFI